VPQPPLLAGTDITITTAVASKKQEKAAGMISTIKHHSISICAQQCKSSNFARKKARTTNLHEWNSVTESCSVDQQRIESNH
jgi:hypothetical protein